MCKLDTGGQTVWAECSEVFVYLEDFGFVVTVVPPSRPEASCFDTEGESRLSALENVNKCIVSKGLALYSVIYYILNLCLFYWKSRFWALPGPGEYENTSIVVVASRRKRQLKVFFAFTVRSFACLDRFWCRFLPYGWRLELWCCQHTTCKLQRYPCKLRRWCRFCGTSLKIIIYGAEWRYMEKKFNISDQCLSIYFKNSG